MTVEGKLKHIIGEQTFAVIMLQTRVEEQDAEIARLKKELEPKTGPDSENKMDDVVGNTGVIVQGRTKK